jgi:hypothetical protein
MHLLGVSNRDSLLSSFCIGTLQRPLNQQDQDLPKVPALESRTAALSFLRQSTSVPEGDHFSE